MGRYANARAKTGLEIPGAGSCRTADDVAAALGFTEDEDPLVRRLALKHLCPCRVKRRDPRVWERILEMAHDPDPGVRMDVIHAMTDGSPRELWPQISGILESLRNDPDQKIRRHVRRTQIAQRLA